VGTRSNHSLDQGICEVIQEFSRISVGRSNPMEHDARPLRETERHAFLRRVAEVNQISSAPEFGVSYSTRNEIAVDKLPLNSLT